jgi:tetratricopeptide (TPR) repeat protein
VTTASEAAAKGYQLRKEGNLPLARECYAEAAQLYRDQKDVLAYAHSIRHIADIYQQEKNPASARTLYEEALEIYRSNLGTRLLDLANTVRPYAILIEEAGDRSRRLRCGRRREIFMVRCGLSREWTSAATTSRSFSKGGQDKTSRQTADWSIDKACHHFSPEIDKRVRSEHPYLEFNHRQPNNGPLRFMSSLFRCGQSIMLLE